MKSKIFEYRYLLLIILFIGLFLRIYGLDKESLYFDSGASLMYAKLNPEQIIPSIREQTI